mgnify:FL=1
MAALRVEDLRGTVEDDILDCLKTLGVKSIIKSTVRYPQVREEVRSLGSSAKNACLVMPYEVVDSISHVLNDLRRFLSETSVLILLSRKVEPNNIYLGVPEN